MVLTEKILEDILSYLGNSMDNLAKEAFNNLEFGEGFEEVDNFLQNQFDVRLENLLVGKNSSIHHLESGMKNKVIQRKQVIFEKIIRENKN